MAKKGQLFFLINSLNKSEKRYFKLFCVHQKVSNNYLRLFEAYEQQEQLDEEAIRKKFEKETFARQLHVTKNYLTQLLLKSLRNYYARLSRQSEIKDILRNIEILFIRELYDHCHYEILRGEKIARKYEQITSLIELLGWKRKLILTREGLRKEAINALLEEEKSLIRESVRQNELWRLTSNIFDYVGPKKDALLREPVIGNYNDLASLKSKILYHHIQSTYHLINGDSQAGIQYLNDSITIMERLPHRIKDDPSSYVTALNNQVGAYIFQKKYKEALELLEKVKAVPEKYQLRSESLFTIRLHLRTFNVELEIYRDTKQWDKGGNLIEKVVDYMEAHRSGVSMQYQLMIYYQFAYIFFMSNNYGKALKWVNEIINGNYGSEREDLQTYTRLLSLMLHLEMGNTIVLKYAVDSCRRFLRRKKKIEPFENILLRFFSRISRAPIAEYKELFQYLHADLLEGEPPAVSPNVLDYLDFRSWIRRKIGRKGEQ